MPTERKYILVEKRGAVARITINRPDKRNALSRDTIREMLAVFEELRSDDSIAVVLTTGAGDISYCAGRDLSEFPTEGGKNRGTDRRAEPRAYHVAEVIRTFPKVTIAVVNGYCLGAGITLLLPHDLAIASDKAQFGLPEIMRGFLPYPIIATMFKFDSHEIRLRDDPHRQELGRKEIHGSRTDQPCRATRTVARRSVEVGRRNRQIRQ